MATMTITTTAGEDARLVAAFCSKLGVGTASAAQIKADVIAYVKSVVRDQERLAAAATANQSDISPT